MSAGDWPDLVIFDCDGVLVDTERISAAVGAEVLSELGWEVSAAEMIERFLGCSDEYFQAEVARRLGPSGPGGWAETLRTRHLEALAAAEPVDGVLDLVDELERRGVATCVASNGSHEKMARTLATTGLLARFRGRIFSADDVAHGKPAPDLFQHAAGSMGVPASRCCVVEDSPRGAAAARAAGMTCIGYAGLTPPGLLAAQGAQVCVSMQEVRASISGAPPSRVA